MGETAMENVLAAIDASVYATSVCGYAGWAASRLSLPVELLHVVQRQDAVTARKDLSGAIGLGVKSDLMEELVRLSEEGSRTEIDKGRIMLKAVDRQRVQKGKSVSALVATGLPRTIHTHQPITQNNHPTT